MAISRLLTGAQVLCYINGGLFGRTAEISWTSNTGRKELRGIDSLEPLELIPTGAAAQGQIKIYKIHKDGGLQGAGLVAHWKDLTKEKYFSIMLLDRVTDTVLFQANRCAVTSEAWNVGRGYVMVSVSFTVLDWNNETQPSST